VHRSIKLKEQFVAMVSHEARAQRAPSFCFLNKRMMPVHRRIARGQILTRAPPLLLVRAQIRTPLNAMSGATALLAGTSPLNEEQRSLLELLDAAADNVETIIDDILQTSALQSGNFPVLREPLLLSRDVLEPAWRMLLLQPARRDKLARLHLSRCVDESVPDALLGDATRLLQVVTNLLSNAAKFTPEGGAIQLCVDVTAPPPRAAVDDVAAAAIAAAAPLPLPPSRWLRIQVVDTGIGIEPGTHARARAHTHMPPMSRQCAQLTMRASVTAFLCRCTWSSASSQNISSLRSSGAVHRARVWRHWAWLDGASRVGSCVRAHASRPVCRHDDGPNDVMRSPSMRFVAGVAACRSVSASPAQWAAR
jgi:hypothetical protein